MNNVIVEIDKRVAVSFSKRFKVRKDTEGNEVSLNLQEVKKEITEYVSKNIESYKDKKVFSFVYDYDLGICVTMMKPQMEYEVYTVIGFLDMFTPEETYEDDEEKEETKDIAKLLKGEI